MSEIPVKSNLLQPTKSENSHYINTCMSSKSPATESIRKSGLKPPSVSKLPANFRRKSVDRVCFLKELEEVVSNGVTVLDKGNAWNERNTFIQKLGNLFANCKSLEPSEVQRAVAALQELVPALKLHLQDVRSAVVRSTCETVGMISKSLGLEFECIATQLIPTLLNLSSVTIGVVSQSGENCVNALIETTRFDLSVVFDACQSGKNESYCRMACEYLTKALQQWQLTDSYDSYVQAAQACLTHQFKKVRRSGCELLTQMANVWPAQVATLAALLEPSMINVFLKEYPESALTEHLRLHHVVKSPVKSSGLSEYKRRASKSKSVSPKQTPLLVEKEEHVPEQLSASVGAPPSSRQEELLKWMSEKEAKGQSNGKLRQRHSDMASPTLKTLLPAYQKRFEANASKRSLSEKLKPSSNPTDEELQQRKEQAQQYLKQAEELDLIRRYGEPETVVTEPAAAVEEEEDELVIPPVVQHTPPGKTTKYVPSSNTVRKVAQRLADVHIEDNDDDPDVSSVTETLADSFDKVAPVMSWSRYLVLFLLGLAASVLWMGWPDFSFSMPVAFTNETTSQQVVIDAEIRAAEIIAQARDAAEARRDQILEEARATAKEIEFQTLEKVRQDTEAAQLKRKEALRIEEEAKRVRKEKERLEEEAKRMEEKVKQLKKVLRQQHQVRLLTDLASVKQSCVDAPAPRRTTAPTPTTATKTTNSINSSTYIAGAATGLLMAMIVAIWKWKTQQPSLTGEGVWEYEVRSDPREMRRRSVVDSPHFSDPGSSPDAHGPIGWISPPPLTSKHNFSDPGALGSFSTLEEPVDSPKTPRRRVRRSGRLSTPRRDSRASSVDFD